MRPQRTGRPDERRLMQDTGVDDWYGDVVAAWDSLLDDGSDEHWRNLGYWAPGTTSLNVASRALAERLSALADVGPGQEVLDVGCGRGDSTRLLRSRVATGRLVGLDLAPRHIAAARTVTGADGPEFMVGNAVDMPFADRSFDRVLALECSFHFPSRRDFFAEARRVLRPGGVLGVADVVIGERSARYRAMTTRLVPRSLTDRTEKYVTEALKNPAENLVPVSGICAQLVELGFRVRYVEDVAKNVFPGFRRHWQRACNPAQQEAVLRRAGMDETGAARAAAAWRAQMRAYVRTWTFSQYPLIVAEVA